MKNYKAKSPIITNCLSSVYFYQTVIDYHSSIFSMEFDTVICQRPVLMMTVIVKIICTKSFNKYFINQFAVFTLLLNTAIVDRLSIKYFCWDPKKIIH